MNRISHSLIIFIFVQMIFSDIILFLMMASFYHIFIFIDTPLPYCVVSLHINLDKLV